MNVDTDKLEERAAVILGQIQASVAEYVRTMNEAGALRRREVDEAQRQQDEAIRVLKAVQAAASIAVDVHSKLTAKLGNDWLGLVERGLRDTAIELARVTTTASVTQIENRLIELSAGVQNALLTVTQLSERNERIARTLAWRTISATTLWIGVVTIGLKLLM